MIALECTFLLPTPTSHFSLSLLALTSYSHFSLCLLPASVSIGGGVLGGQFIGMVVIPG